MRQIILISSLLLLMEATRAQDSPHITSSNDSIEKKYNNIPKLNSKEYFQEKGSCLNTTGWVLIGAAAVLGVTGAIIYENSLNSDNLNQLGNILGGYFCAIAGSAMVVVGIPVLIRSGYYKRKALNMSTSLKIEPYQSGLAMKHYPAIGFTIQL